MDQIPLPSLVHYELLLQLLERQSIHAVDQNPALREQIHQLIITIRKALAQQRQIETICNQANIDYEHRWSLNSVGTMANDDDVLPQVFQSLEQ